MTVVVLSNKEQYRALLGKFPKTDDVKIICDNPSFYDFLKDRNIAFDSLGDEYLKDSWSKINAWACTKALNWDRLTAGSFFNGIKLNNALYVYFSYYLVSFLKNYLFSEYICDRYRPAKLIIFENVYCPDFPAFNGNYFLNVFLKEKAKRSGLEVERLKSEEAGAKAASGIKGKAKNFIQGVYRILPIPSCRRDIFLVRGSLQHLSSVIKELRQKRGNVFLYGFEFNFEQFVFCLKHGIGYILPEHFHKNRAQNGIDGCDYKKNFNTVIELMRSQQWFKYDDTNLSEFVCDELFLGAGKYLESISLDSEIYSNITGAYNIKSLIVNEDIAPKSAFMSAFFKSKGIKTFCTSHGYGPVKFSLNEEDRTFYLSETFVHSEYEKYLYASWGWDSGHLHVAGMPRYDKLISCVRKDGEKKRPSRTIKLLLCGSTMFEYSPSQVSYIGIRQYDVGNNMKRLLKDVIEAIDGYDIKLIVKPHNVGEERLWLEFIKKHKRGNDISLISAKKDFFDLLSRCDAMILGYWSTAIIEAVIAALPVIVVNYSGFEDGHPFAKENLCLVSRSRQQLKSIIDATYSALSFGKLLQHNNENKMFYLGENDGKNTQRIISKILNFSDNNAKTEDAS